MQLAPSTESTASSTSQTGTGWDSNSVSKAPSRSSSDGPVSVTMSAVSNQALPIDETLAKSLCELSVQVSSPTAQVSTTDEVAPHLGDATHYSQNTLSLESFNPQQAAALLEQFQAYTAQQTSQTLAMAHAYSNVAAQSYSNATVFNPNWSVDLGSALSMAMSPVGGFSPNAQFQNFSRVNTATSPQLQDLLNERDQAQAELNDLLSQKSSLETEVNQLAKNFSILNTNFTSIKGDLIRTSQEHFYLKQSHQNLKSGIQTKTAIKAKLERDIKDQVNKLTKLAESISTQESKLASLVNAEKLILQNRQNLNDAVRSFDKDKNAFQEYKKQTEQALAQERQSIDSEKQLLASQQKMIEEQQKQFSSLMQMHQANIQRSGPNPYPNVLMSMHPPMLMHPPMGMQQPPMLMHPPMGMQQPPMAMYMQQPMAMQQPPMAVHMQQPMQMPVHMQRPMQGRVNMQQSRQMHPRNNHAMQSLRQAGIVPPMPVFTQGNVPSK